MKKLWIMFSNLTCIYVGIYCHCKINRWQRATSIPSPQASQSQLSNAICLTSLRRFHTEISTSGESQMGTEAHDNVARRSLESSASLLEHRQRCEACGHECATMCYARTRRCQRREKDRTATRRLRRPRDSSSIHISAKNRRSDAKQTPIFRAFRAAHVYVRRMYSRHDTCSRGGITTRGLRDISSRAEMPEYV